MLADLLCMFLFKEESGNTPVINLSLQTPEPSVVLVGGKLQELIENEKNKVACLPLRFTLSIKCKTKCFILTEATRISA